MSDPLATFLEHLPLAAMLTDADARIQRVNAKFIEVTGYLAEEVVGKTPRVLHSGRQDKAFYHEMWERLRSDGRWEGQIWNRRRSGEIYLHLLSICAVGDGDTLRYAAVYSEVTQFRTLEDRLLYMAYHDPLTHLPNRLLFIDRMERALMRAKRSGSKFGLMVVDLDDFKGFNDELGHPNGDRVLRMAAHMMCGVLRESDTVCRFGGDEFAIIVEDARDAEDIAAVAQRLVQSFERPVHLAPHTVAVSVSIGVAVYPDDGADGSVLLEKADAAMYRAKAAGKNTFRL